MGLLGSLFGSRSRGLFGFGGGLLSSPLKMALIAFLVSRMRSKQTSGTGTTAIASLLSGGGLGALLQQFQKSGYGDVIKSWIDKGQNQKIAPDQLEMALGDDTVSTLSKQTGMPKNGLLAELAKLLPGVIDKLTPDGRVPHQEANQNTAGKIDRDIA
ncbi:MAG: YidB family protein [Pseudomonadota bacterium]